MTDSGKTSEETSAPQFEVVFTEDARSDVEALDGSVKKQVAKIIKKKIAVNPEAYGTPLRSSSVRLLEARVCEPSVDLSDSPGKEENRRGLFFGPRKAGDAADIYFQLNKVAESGRLAEQVTSILETILPDLKRKKKK